jgi:hypothetical protein
MNSIVYKPLSASEPDLPAAPLSRKIWVAWSAVAAGLLALACGLFLSISEAVAGEDGPTVAIVIDDVGLDQVAAERGGMRLWRICRWSRAGSPIQGRAR